MRLPLIGLVMLSCHLALSCGTPGSPINCPKDADFTEIHGDGSFTTAQHKSAQRKADNVRRDFERKHFVAMAERTNTALEAVIRIGYLNLRKHGYLEDAAWLNTEWRSYNGELIRIVSNPNRDIGDFTPLSTYLALAYELLEYKLGYKLCYTLRLTDIKTLNFAIPVVFAPCKYGLVEFEKHFIHDDKYRGLAGVVTYWTTVISCSVATYGAGYFFICSPLGMLTELVMDKSVAPWLAPKIYDWAC